MSHAINPDRMPRAFVSGCLGKARFDTPALAHRVQKRRGRHDKNGTVYRCKHCGGWHIGRRPDQR